MGRSAPASVHDQPHRTHALTSVRTLFVCRSLVMVFDSVFSNSFVNSKDDCADHAIISDTMYQLLEASPRAHSLLLPLVKELQGCCVGLDGVIELPLDSLLAPR